MSFIQHHNPFNFLDNALPTYRSSPTRSQHPTSGTSQTLLIMPSCAQLGSHNKQEVDTPLSLHSNATKFTFQRLTEFRPTICCSTTAKHLKSAAPLETVAAHLRGLGCQVGPILLQSGHFVAAGTRSSTDTNSLLAFAHHPDDLYIQRQSACSKTIPMRLHKHHCLGVSTAFPNHCSRCLFEVVAKRVEQEPS